MPLSKNKKKIEARRSKAGELREPSDAVEVPVGHSADAAYDPQQYDGAEPEPDTTGGTLHDDGGRPPGYGMHEIDMRLSPVPAAPEDRITARPTHILEDLEGDEHYDALDPEEAGTEWLRRATGSDAERKEPNNNLDTQFMQSDISAPVVSESSRFTARELEGMETAIDGEQPEELVSYVAPAKRLEVPTKRLKPAPK